MQTGENVKKDDTLLDQTQILTILIIILHPHRHALEQSLERFA